MSHHRTFVIATDIPNQQLKTHTSSRPSILPSTHSVVGSRYFPFYHWSVTKDIGKKWCAVKRKL